MKGASQGRRCWREQRNKGDFFFFQQPELLGGCQQVRVCLGARGSSPEMPTPKLPNLENQLGWLKLVGGENLLPDLFTLTDLTGNEAQMTKPSTRAFLGVWGEDGHFRGCLLLPSPSSCFGLCGHLEAFPGMTRQRFSSIPSSQRRQVGWITQTKDLGAFCPV